MWVEHRKASEKHTQCDELTARRRLSKDSIQLCKLLVQRIQSLVQQFIRFSRRAGSCLVCEFLLDAENLSLDFDYLSWNVHYLQLCCRLFSLVEVKEMSAMIQVITTGKCFKCESAAHHGGAGTVIMRI